MPTEDTRIAGVRGSGARHPLARAVESRWDNLIAPQGSTAALKELVQWLAVVQGTAEPRAGKRVLVLAVGEHGIAEAGVSAYPAEVTAQMVASVRRGQAMVCQLCRVAGVEVRLVDCCDFGKTKRADGAQAMSRADFNAARQRGMAAINGDEDVVIVGEMGIGNTTIAAALSLLALQPQADSSVVARFTGRGTGIDDSTWRHKCDVVMDICHRHRGKVGEELLRCAGGYELAAIFGAVQQAKESGVAVMLDGYATTAAVAPAAMLDSGCISHCRAAHVSREAGHRLLLEAMGLKPLLDLRLGLGEGSGGVLALSLVESALAIYYGTATFEQASVANRCI